MMLIVLMVLRVVMVINMPGDGDDEADNDGNISSNQDDGGV